MFVAEQLQSLVFGRGGEGEIARVGEHFSRLHDAVDAVLGRFFLFFPLRCERRMHLSCGPPALAGMCLVDDYGELTAAVLVADLVENVGKLLHGGDDYLLPTLDERAVVRLTPRSWPLR